MPIGFFDKYFNEDEDDHLVLLHNARNKDTLKDSKPVVEKEIPVLVKDRSIVDAEKQRADKQEADKQQKLEKQKEDMKARILQAAQQYMVSMNKSTRLYFY